MKIVIIIVVILAILGGIAFWRFGYLLQPKAGPSQTELTLWGLWEDASLISPAISEYERQNPNVKITYVHQNAPNYRTRVQTQITESSGPDMFMIHNSWLSMFLNTNSLSSVPSSVMSVTDFEKTFYPVASETLISNGKIYALPQEIDGIAMFYNEDLLNAASVSVPTNWDQFLDSAVKLTQKDEQGNIVVAGGAMGSPSNVDHWSEILGTLFLQQPGADLENPSSKAGSDAVRFFTSFITDPGKQTWSLDLEPSTQAFYEGKLAFYFAPSWRAYDLREANPTLKFKTAPVPQLPKPSSDQYAAWGTFWAFSVSNKSSNQLEAWKFLKFLTNPDIEKLLYQEASKQRLFGQPYSRVDLASELSGDPIVGSFVKQGPIYKSWYLNSRTFDSGINDEMITYFENAVNATLQGDNPATALQTTQRGVEQILDKYTKPPTPVPSPTSL